MSVVATGIARRTIAWPALSAGTTRTARSALWWHGNLVVDLSDRGDQQTLCAVAGNNDFAVLNAFQCGFEAVESQIALLPVFTVAPETRRLEQQADILGVSDPLL